MTGVARLKRVAIGIALLGFGLFVTYSLSHIDVITSTPELWTYFGFADVICGGFLILSSFKRQQPGGAVMRTWTCECDQVNDNDCENCTNCGGLHDFAID